MNIIVTGKDTASLVSLSQTNSYNHAFQDLKACNKLADSLWSNISTLQLRINDDNRYMKDADEQVFKLTQQFQEQKVIVDLKDKQLKREVRNKKLSKLVSYIGIPVAFIAGGYIGVMAGK